MTNPLNTQGRRHRAARQVIADALEPRRLLSTFYVDVNSAGPTYDGASWASAYVDLQQGLAAATAGDDVRVADGTYKPTSTTDRTATFQLKNGVTLLGGYAGYGAIDPDAHNVAGTPSVLSGEIGDVGTTLDNSYHVVTGSGTDATAIIDGFTITRGRARETVKGMMEGAGMYNAAGSPSVNNCTFRSNSARQGGGMYNASGTAPSLTECTFLSNSADDGSGMYNDAASPTLINCVLRSHIGLGALSRGGGMYNAPGSSPTLTDCFFSSGSANSGGGMYNDTSTPTLIGCRFSTNQAANGGGIYNDKSNAIVIDSIFEGNGRIGLASGGGIYDVSSASALIRCTFTRNISGQGAGIAEFESSSVLTECFFLENSSTTGGGMWNVSSNPTLNNCTFIQNRATVTGGGISNLWGSFATVTNCIFNGNLAYFAGGGVCIEDSSAMIADCTFAGNRSLAIGAAVAQLDSTNEVASRLVNCTITANVADSASGGVSAESSMNIDNCIIWANEAPRNPQMFAIYPASTVSYCDIQGGYFGPGNIDADPQFLRNPSPGPDNTWGTPDDDYGDLRLQPTSPCIDAGNNAAVPAGITTDLDGNDRIVDFPGVNDPGAIVDMGAYERPLALAVSSAGFTPDGSAPTLRFTLNNVLDPATIDPADVRVRRILPGNVAGEIVAISAMQYDPATRTLTMTLPITLADGNYQATLLPGSVADTYSIGPANGYDLDFFILAGDANRDRVVDVRDLHIVLGNWKQSDQVFTDGDFNYDGMVDKFDLRIVARNMNNSVPPPSAILPRRGPNRIAEALLA